MPVKPFIDTSRCIGCAICVKSCPRQVFSLLSGEKPVVKYPERCDGCGICVKSCIAKAVSLIDMK
ncbi:MAG: ferredoxin [Candidatus Methanomethylicota archaeon]|uniref:Ferredoxin n=1 Tax=Thermoproteota archaeon TaxID=2056631 RepID=A0A497EP90_9CREN|nr:MAG: ferredoxin [Candidatus Verstraetearchaeota archaeon]RLE53322.1 MAG: ferredoxin [Candidatus Verstraetearchaeota archaeon]